MEEVYITHPFPPVYDENARVLILGTLPSVKSRENQYYYGHPQNRFWPLLATLLQKPCPQTVGEKEAFLRQSGVALWDVLASCRIQGSADSSIREPKANDIWPILRKASIRAIYTNGQKAKALYDQYLLPQTGRSAVALPSTSPANGRYTMAQLIAAWTPLAEHCKE